jgi:sugar phosphate permease
MNTPNKSHSHPARQRQRISIASARGILGLAMGIMYALGAFLLGILPDLIPAIDGNLRIVLMVCLGLYGVWRIIRGIGELQSIRRESKI